MKHADGVWLDGIGPDNGAYMCAGVCCGYGPNNSPLLAPEIEDHCAKQADATTIAQKWLIANGGWEAQKCFDYLESELPTHKDSPQSCASKLQKYADFGANHSNYNFVVAYGSRTGGRGGYDDETAAGTVTAFLLMRGQHWLFSIAPTPGSFSGARTNNNGNLTLATAKLFLSDYGAPKGSMTPVAGKSLVFQREFESATVSLDCNTWTATFDERLSVE